MLFIFVVIIFKHLIMNENELVVPLYNFHLIEETLNKMINYNIGCLVEMPLIIRMNPLDAEIMIYQCSRTMDLLIDNDSSIYVLGLKVIKDYKQEFRTFTLEG